MQFYSAMRSKGKFYLVLQFKAKDFTPRTPESYNYHCSLLDGLLADEDSVTYGVLYASPLNEIDHFHVIGQLPQDIMHVLLEGVIPYEVTLMLRDFVIDRKYLTPTRLNDRIACFSFTGQEAKDKPSPIVFSSQGMRLSQTGYSCI